MAISRRRDGSRESLQRESRHGLGLEGGSRIR
jgi:hypothetical protein